MITLNISGIDAVMQRLESIDMDMLCFDIASSLKAKVKHRVHVEGKASDGSQIGTYSESYMKVRTNNFKSKAIVRGKNKGNPRTVYKRGADTKIILSLTRQMEKDFDATKPIPITNGYGIGYSNSHNYEKARWNEERYGKQIFAPSDSEKALAKEIVSNYVAKINND